MLQQNLIPVITDELNTASDIVWRKTVEDTGTVTLTTNERRAIWNALQHAQRLLSVVVPMQVDLIKALELLDAQGIWTGVDDLLHDRVSAVLNDYRTYKAQAEDWKHLAEQRGRAIMPFAREFDEQVQEAAEIEPNVALDMFMANLTIGDARTLFESVRGDANLWKNSSEQKGSS